MTFLILAGVLFLGGDTPFGRRPGLAGFFFAMAALTRPDALLFVVLGVGWRLALRAPREALWLGASFLLFWAPVTVARGPTSISRPDASI